MRSLARNPDPDPMIFPTEHQHWYGKLTSRTPGRPWMLILHGFLGCTEAMSPLAQRIASSCNPLLLDLPGHGETRSTSAHPLPNGLDGDPDAGFRVQSQIEDLESIIDRLQCGPVWLYGYSMGGRLALQLAINRPDRVCGLILESSTPGIASEDARKERQMLDRKRAGKILRDLPDFLEKWEQMPLFRSGTVGERPSNAISGKPSSEVETTEGPVFPKPCSHSPEGLAASLLGFGTGQMPSVWESLTRVGVPVLLLSGEGDSKFNGLHRKMARLLPNATNRVVEGAAHRVHRDRPDTVAQHVADFLSQR